MRSKKKNLSTYSLNIQFPTTTSQILFLLNCTDTIDGIGKTIYIFTAEMQLGTNAKKTNK